MERILMVSVYHGTDGTAAVFSLYINTLCSSWLETSCSFNCQVHCVVESHDRLNHINDNLICWKRNRV